MKEVSYPPESAPASREMALMTHATKVLNAAIGPNHSDQVAATWSRLEDEPGNTLYRLAIRDRFGEVHTDFTSEQLTYPLHLRVRVLQLWGDLLQVRSDIQHERTLALFREFERDEVTQ